MRKKRLKQLQPNRNKIYEILRERREYPHIMIDDKGNKICLNLRKHFLFGRPYKNQEYQLELERNRRKFINEGGVVDGRRNDEKTKGVI